MLKMYIQRGFRMLKKKVMPPQESVIDRKDKHLGTHWFVYLPKSDRNRRLLRQCTALALGCIFVFSGINLLNYGVEYLISLRTSRELRRVYNEELAREHQTTPTILTTQAPTATPAATEPTAIPTETAVTEQTVAPVLTPVPTEAPTPTPASRLPQVPYPSNPYAIASSRFQKLRRQNEDIIGWLTIEDMVDEAVVQRDNQYYLARDYLGYHNANGAIFLDEATKLRTRPYTLMLYGHNMKTGRMFGNLRNYENATFYHNDPFITFDTLYEDGRFVIFAACTVSTNASNWRYFNWGWLNSSSIEMRQRAIDSLFRFSVYNKGIDVTPEDQILLLITCVDDPDDRRVIAARRIRPGETEEELQKQVRRIKKK